MFKSILSAETVPVISIFLFLIFFIIWLNKISSFPIKPFSPACGFNPVTNISFSIADEGQISLKIFDLLGTQVNELVNDFYTPGNYNVIWNAVDTYGNEVSSGVYIYQLSTKDGIFTNRMMLMR